MYLSCKETYHLIMESLNEFSCMRVNMDDLASWEEVSELYFRAREDQSDQQVDGSPWDDSSSESGEDECLVEEEIPKRGLENALRSTPTTQKV